jgi:hypothetical protein
MDFARGNSLIIKAKDSTGARGDGISSDLAMGRRVWLFVLQKIGQYLGRDSLQTSPAGREAFCRVDAGCGSRNSGAGTGLR